MIEPSPNCLVIWSIASTKALSLPSFAVGFSAISGFSAFLAMFLPLLLLLLLYRLSSLFATIGVHETLTRVYRHRSYCCCRLFGFCLGAAAYAAQRSCRLAARQPAQNRYQRHVLQPRRGVL